MTHVKTKHAESACSKFKMTYKYAYHPPFKLD